MKPARPPIPPPLASRGTTLTELALVLALAGVVFGTALPGVRALLDRSRVVAAREELLGLVHRARAVAPATGGATITLDLEAERVELVDGAGRVIESLDLGARGVDLRSTGTASTVTIEWNALGWGVVASRSLVLRAGGAEARLVISSRGRASRR
ncbi:MAG: hypothetical protein RQ745_01680 [Longimicrobiales bacterium]|nr:hypothetical protein [Longimicrobiales bacterium]